LLESLAILSQVAHDHNVKLLNTWCLQAKGMQSEYLRATSKDDSSSAGQRGDKSEVSKLISDKARLQEALETAQVQCSVKVNRCAGAIALHRLLDCSICC
jgi:hypothetical protein